MPDLILRGVPNALSRDAWWLSGGTLSAVPGTNGNYSRGQPPTSTSASPRRRAELLLVLTVVAFADYLFWGHRPGLSLAVFALVIFGIVWVLVPDRPDSTRNRLSLIAGAVLTVLPVLETVQLLSLGFLVAGTLVTITTLILGHRIADHSLSSATFRLLQAMVSLAPRDVAQAATRAGSSTLWTNLLRVWVLPLSVGSVFIALLGTANPIAEAWLEEVADAFLSLDVLSGRPLFWALVATLVWPVLVPKRIRDRLFRPFLRSTREHIQIPRQFGSVFNPDSVARSLVLFNLIFAVQTGLDIRYLWSGSALPDGLTYAGYAHRGAYPLVATALLAGAFALACRRITSERRDLTALLIVWVLQNVALMISALYRLDLYVLAYGLTYLRCAAAIWMGLVAFGLLTIIWQVWRAKSNLWLLRRNAMMLAVTLYACCFVNFADLIAANNLAHDSTLQAGDGLDADYLCTLGTGAAGALRRHEIRTGTAICPASDTARGPVISGWRDWGFRSWRIRRYLDATETTKAVANEGENPHRR